MNYFSTMHQTPADYFAVISCATYLWVWSAKAWTIFPCSGLFYYISAQNRVFYYSVRRWNKGMFIYWSSWIFTQWWSKLDPCESFGYFWYFVLFWARTTVVKSVSYSSFYPLAPGVPLNIAKLGEGWGVVAVLFPSGTWIFWQISVGTFLATQLAPVTLTVS